MSSAICKVPINYVGYTYTTKRQIAQNIETGLKTIGTQVTNYQQIVLSRKGFWSTCGQRTTVLAVRKRRRTWSRALSCSRCLGKNSCLSSKTVPDCNRRLLIVGREDPPEFDWIIIIFYMQVVAWCCLKTKDKKTFFNLHKYRNIKQNSLYQQSESDNSIKNNNKKQNRNQKHKIFVQKHLFLNLQKSSNLNHWYRKLLERVTKTFTLLR